MNIKNIIFDLDGTLIDSHAGIADSFNAAYKLVFGKENTIDILPMIGPPLAKMIDLVFTDIQPHQKQKLIDEFKILYDSNGFKLTKLFANTKETLQYLHTKYKLFIATNKRYMPSVQILEYLEISQYFTDTVFALDKQIPHYENKPKMVEDIIHKFKLNKNETILIGDTFSDKNAAEKNQIQFIYCCYGYENNMQADIQIKTINELMNIL